MLRLALIFAAVLACARGKSVADPPAPAGTAPAGPFGVVRGVIIDSATGVPVLRTWAHLQGPRGARYARGDRTGTFRIDSVAPGRDTLFIACEQQKSVFGMHLASRPVEVPPGDSLFVRFVVDATGCDMRPLREVTGEFRGHWTAGFEVSAFAACGDSTRATVDLTPAAHAQLQRTRPRGGGDEDYTTYYVRWRGTFEGPGRYGHLGASHYRLLVTEILELRRKGRRDCR